jgi:hypothetical protein
VAYEEGTDFGDYEVMLLVEMWPDGVMVMLDEMVVQEEQTRGDNDQT